MYSIENGATDINTFFTDLTNNQNNAKDALSYFDKNLFEAFYNRTAVYFLIKNDNIVYIGETNQIAARIAQHIYSKKDFDEFYFVFTKNKKDAEKLESKLIRYYKPLLNIQMGKSEIAEQLGMSQSLFNSFYIKRHD